MDDDIDDDSKYRRAVWISTCSCVLSILGSLTILASFIAIPDIRNSTRKLITCLTAADFLTALGYLIAALAYFTGTQDGMCTAQSVITTYSSLVSFYITVAIAIHIFSTVVYRQDLTSSRKFLLWANVTSWLVPGIIIGFAGKDHVLGRSAIRNTTGIANNNTVVTQTAGTGPWCWLKLHHSRYIFWVFMTGKGWEFACYLIMTSLYVLLKLYVYLRHRRQTFTEIHTSLREDDQNFLYVCFVLYVLRLWGSVRSMMYIACTSTDHMCKDVSDVLMYIQAFGDPAQAFCNCILFCFLDDSVRSYIFRPCCGRSNNHFSNAEAEPLVNGGQTNTGTSGDEDRYSEVSSHEHFTEHSGIYSSFSKSYRNSPTAAARHSISTNVQSKHSSW